MNITHGEDGQPLPKFGLDSARVKILEAEVDRLRDRCRELDNVNKSVKDNRAAIEAESAQLRKAIVFANGLGNTPPDEMEWFRCRERFEKALGNACS